MWPACLWSLLCLRQYILFPTSQPGYTSCLLFGCGSQWSGPICLLCQLVLVDAVSGHLWQGLCTFYSHQRQVFRSPSCLSRRHGCHGNRALPHRYPQRLGRQIICCVDCSYFDFGLDLHLPTLCWSTWQVAQSFPGKRELIDILSLGWALLAEIGSTRLRQKTVCLACNVTQILCVICGTLENHFVNPTAWNLKGYTGYVSSFNWINLLELLWQLCLGLLSPSRSQGKNLWRTGHSSLGGFLLVSSLPPMLTLSTIKRTTSSSAIHSQVKPQSPHPGNHNCLYFVGAVPKYQLKLCKM